MTADSVWFGPRLVRVGLGDPAKRISWDRMDPLVAAQALALLALVLATYRYARIVRRRALARRQQREREEVGLRGLVRVLGADRERKHAPRGDGKPSH